VSGTSAALENSQWSGKTQMPLAGLLARFQKKGFEGPYYRGILGKARFLLESVGWRTEFVFAGTRESLALACPLRSTKLILARVTSFSELETFRGELEREYYQGYLEAWRRPFTWGEQLVIGTVDGRIAAFAWVQRGTQEGFPTYYGRLFESDARILRVGVVPSFRRQGLNSAMMHGLLERLLAEGFRRVFAESHKYNVPSVRTFLKVGFRAVGAIRIVTVPGGREFLRWASSADFESHLRELDINLDATPQ
jgi:ribosomal protein S18 acetylase RimI-like enzyme